MRWSIIIPIWNGAATLPAAVHSALRVPDSEILLIDDGSTDGSGALADNYGKIHPQVRCFHQENRGVSAARNLGLSQAKGEFVLFLDADDTLCPLPDMPAADCVIFGGGPVDLETLFAENRLSPVWNKCFRRAVLEKHRLRFREALFVYEDLEFSARFLACCAGVAFVPDPLCRHTPSGRAPERAARLENLAQVVEPVRQALPPDSRIPAKLAVILSRELLAARPCRWRMIWREVRGYAPALNFFKWIREGAALWRKR